jgi:hypothetical protein
MYSTQCILLFIVHCVLRQRGPRYASSIFTCRTSLYISDISVFTSFCIGVPLVWRLCLCQPERSDRYIHAPVFQRESHLRKPLTRTLFFLAAGPILSCVTNQPPRFSIKPLNNQTSGYCFCPQLSGPYPCFPSPH